MTVTATLSAFVSTCSIKALPPEVVRRTTLLVLDLAGNAVRARHDAESTPALAAAVAALAWRTARPVSSPTFAAMRLQALR